MTSLDVNFEDKEFVSNFIKQYKKYISKNIKPKHNTKFKVGKYKCNVRYFIDYAHTLIITNAYKSKNFDYDVVKKNLNLNHNLAVFNIFSNYFIVADDEKLYINGIRIMLKNTLYFDIYNDYLTIGSKHIATFESIEPIIRLIKYKLTKFKGDAHLYRGIPIIEGKYVRLDRYLLSNYKSNKYSCLQLSI